MGGCLIGNGKLCKFWEDCWINNVPLKKSFMKIYISWLGILFALWLIAGRRVPGIWTLEEA
jgi:hypothetical protein